MINSNPMVSNFPSGIYKSAFRPAWWLRGEHAQTLFATLFRTPPVLARSRETLALNDGDFLEIDWFKPELLQENAPIVAVVHGLSGSSDSHYVLGLQSSLAKLGWQSAALNCRGASGRSNWLPRAYHAGSSDDILHALHYIREKYPASPLALVGYSLGGNMTLKLLGEVGDSAPVFAGVAVSVPLLLGVCADRLDSGFSRVYRKHLLKELHAMWQEKIAHFAEQKNTEAIAIIQQKLSQGPFHSFWHYDNAVMAPLHGFKDVNDYYEKCASRPALGKIKVPTLVIQSSDDPFMSQDILPEAKELSASMHFELAEKGGHVGFIEGGTLRAPRYYLERRIPEFLQWQFAKQNSV